MFSFFSYLSGLLGSLGTALTLGVSAGALLGILSIFITGWRGALMVAGVSALAIVGAWTGGYARGYAKVENAVELAQAQAKIKAVEHEKKALEEVIKLQNEQEEQNLKELAADDEKIAALEKLLASRPTLKVETCKRAATQDEMRAIERIK